MNKEEFVKLLATYEKCLTNIHELYNVGVDVTESKYALPIEPIVDIILGSIYDENGVDWINWFIYETNFGKRAEMEAHDEYGARICQTVEALYDFVEQYKK
jgi:hypothetical protein